MSKSIEQLEAEYKEAGTRLRGLENDMRRIRGEIADAKLAAFPLAGHKVSFEHDTGFGKNRKVGTITFLVEKVGFHIEGRTFKKDGTLGSRVTRYYPASRENPAEGLTDHGAYEVQP